MLVNRSCKSGVEGGEGLGVRCWGGRGAGCATSELLAQGPEADRGKADLTPIKMAPDIDLANVFLY